jgi:acylphosphatase
LVLDKKRGFYPLFLCLSFKFLFSSRKLTTFSKCVFFSSNNFEKHFMHMELKVSGLVQGVGLRADIKEKANELNLTGWVKNESDSTVTVLISGDESAMYQFTDWLWEPNCDAQVDDVKEQIFDTEEQFEGFSIRL